MTTYSILFLGDIVGRPGRVAVREALPSLRETYQPLFCIANAENAASGVGLTPDLAAELLGFGLDVLTLGNHAFHKREIVAYLPTTSRIIRPSNLPAGTPGVGAVSVERDGVTLSIANLCGRVFLEGYDDPFREAARLRDVLPGHLFIDFHGEATSEKIALSWWMDGKATAVVGTHTHVQTADERILPEGTAAITDVGMCGPHNGVIGMARDVVLQKFLTSMPARFEVADGPGIVHGVVIEVERDTGRSVQIERIRFET